MTVRVALIGGPMYNALYTRLDQFSQQSGVQVEIAFIGDHPTLNMFLATDAAADCHVVSTHTKYAPSQRRLLAPLDELLTPAELSDFMPSLLELARIDGQLYGIPRNIDVRLLHYRTDLIDHPPATWDELLDLARRVNHPPEWYGFLFPGTESGLFGTFYELVESTNARLFSHDLTPDIENDGGRWALGFLRACYAEGLVPPEIVTWHYDEVHLWFRAGRAAMVGDWPGYYADYCAADSPVRKRFALALYPAGPAGVVRVYGGSHTFALTCRGVEQTDAVALLRFLTAPEQQLLEAEQGSTPVRHSVMQRIEQHATPHERRRWATLAAAIERVVIPPTFEQYPLVEQVLWTTVQQAMVGAIAIDDALHMLTDQITRIVAGNDE